MARVPQQVIFDTPFGRVETGQEFILQTTPAPSPWGPRPDDERPVPYSDWELINGQYNGWSFGWGTGFDITNVDGFADMMELKTQDAQLRGDGEVFGEDYEKKRVLTVEFNAMGAMLEACFPRNPGFAPDYLMDARCACMRRGNMGDLPLTLNDRWLIMARPRKFVVPQRRGDPPKLTVSWEAADPALYEADEQTASTTLQISGLGRPYPRPSGAPGATFPGRWTWRYRGRGTGGLMDVVNRGCRRTYLRARIVGPVYRPMLINQDTFERIEFNLNLDRGETLDIDMRRGTVLLNGTASRYYQITNDSTWWACAPGTTLVRYLSRGAVTASRATIWWRSAW